jgi:hypothetical protein
MQVEIVSMHGDALVFELDDDLHAVAFSACGKGQEGMFVKTKLRENALARGSGRIVTGFLGTARIVMEEECSADVSPAVATCPLNYS